MDADEIARAAAELPVLTPARRAESRRALSAAVRVVCVHEPRESGLGMAGLGMPALAIVLFTIEWRLTLAILSMTPVVLIVAAGCMQVHWRWPPIRRIEHD